MNSFVAAFAICCLGVAQARPGHIDLSALSLLAGGGGVSASGGSAPGIDASGGGSPPPQNFQLMGVPDDSSFASLSFPDQQIQDLGTVSEGEIPPESVKVTKTITIKIPQPYPVNVPHPVPVPVSVPRPVPIPVTKLVHIPKPYPVEVTRNIPVPVEVPSSGISGGGGYGGDLGGSAGGYDQHGGYSSNQAQIQQVPQQH